MFKFFDKKTKDVYTIFQPLGEYLLILDRLLKIHFSGAFHLLEDSYVLGVSVI